MNFNGGYPLAGTVNSEVNCLLYMLNINMHIVMMTSTFLSVCLCCQKSPNSDSIFLAALIWVFLYCARSTHCAKWGKSARSWLGKSILKSFVQTLMISASFRFVVIVHVSIGVCTRNSTGLQRTTAPHHFPFSCQIKVSLPPLLDMQRPSAFGGSCCLLLLLLLRVGASVVWLDKEIIVIWLEFELCCDAVAL